jgi:hypothetical protein
MNSPAPTHPKLVHATNPALPSRAYYKYLASALILDPKMWQQFYDRCRAMAAAKLYGHSNPNTVAGVVLKGYSLGMDFMEALSKLKVIDGTPVLRGPNAIAHIHSVVPGARCRCITDLIRRDGITGDVPGFPGIDREKLVAQFTHENPDCWTGDRLDPALISVWLMSRPEWEDRVFTFTMAQAETAGLPSRNENWSMYPDRCLKWQAASVGTQEIFGDELEGMYLAEELENSPRPETRRERKAPEPEPQPLPDGVDAEEFELALTELGRLLRELGLKYAFVCEAALGETLGSRKPTYEQLNAIKRWIGKAGDTMEGFTKGQKYETLQLKIYPAEFSRWRPVVEETTPNSGRGMVWGGSARREKEQAMEEGAIAAFMALLRQPLPDRGEDDEPDPEIVAAAEAALAVEQEKIAKQEASQSPETRAATARARGEVEPVEGESAEDLDHCVYEVDESQEAQYTPEETEA